MTGNKKEEKIEPKELIDPESKAFYENYLTHYKTLRGNGFDDELIKNMINANILNQAMLEIRECIELK